MSKRAKTLTIISTALEVLKADNPMTVRQVYYQLVARQVIENKRSQYQAVSRALVDARKGGTIPWSWIEDRLRQPRIYEGYFHAREFLNEKLDLGFYFRHPWQDRDHLVELWLEKDALSGILNEYASEFYLTLNVGRGFDGWSSIHGATERYGKYDRVTILYFGDFDPSGEEMFESLKKRPKELNCLNFEVVKAALTLDDIAAYNLPTDFAKKSDSRYKKFVAKYGDVACELDALPAAELRARVRSSILDYIDSDVFEKSKRIQKLERAALAKIETSLKKSAVRLVSKELGGL